MWSVLGNPFGSGPGAAQSLGEGGLDPEFRLLLRSAGRPTSIASWAGCPRRLPRRAGSWTCCTTKSRKRSWSSAALRGRENVHYGVERSPSGDPRSSGHQCHMTSRPLIYVLLLTLTTSRPRFLSTRRLKLILIR